MSEHVIDVTELLTKMVSYETINANISGKPRPESELADYLEGLAGHHGLATRRVEVQDRTENLLITYERDSSLPWILFDSHLDTVAVDGMTIDPFVGEVRDGKLWGRGACDTKGTGAAMFCALASYASQENSGKNNIALLFSVDEEWGMRGMRTFISEHYPHLGFVPKGAVVGEPTQLKPVVAHNGVVRYVITTHGVAAHSSDPSLGKSAISTMARLITFIETEFIPQCNQSHELTGSAQCSINVIHGGVVANIIPELCVIHIDRRTVPGEKSAKVIEEMRNAIDGFVRDYPNETIDFEVSIDTPSLSPKTGATGSDGGITFADSVINAMSRAGRDEKAIGVMYATHAGDLSRAGIPSMVLGPGDIAQGHTHDEWIDVAELREGVRIYLEIMSSA